MVIGFPYLSRLLLSILPLRPHDRQHRLLRMVKAGVGIGVHRDLCVGVTHQVLQGFDIHSGVGHVGAEGVAQDMGRDHREGFRVGAAVFVHRPFQVVVKVQSHIWILILIQQEESRVTVYHQLLLGLGAASQDVFQASVYLVRHGEHTDAAFGLGLLYVVDSAPFLDKLPFHSDPAPVEVQIRDSQPAQLSDPQAGMEQQVELVIIPPVIGIRPQEVHESLLFLRGQGFSGHGRILDHSRQTEGEGIAADHILLPSHLKGGLADTPDAGDGGISPAIGLELLKPELGIGNLDGADPSVAEVLLLHQIQNEAVANLCVMPVSLLQGDIAIQKLNHRDLAVPVVDAVLEIVLNQCLLPAQLMEVTGIDRLPVALEVVVAEHESAILALSLSAAEEAAFGVFSFGASGHIGSFPWGAVAPHFLYIDQME